MLKLACEKAVLDRQLQAIGYRDSIMEITSNLVVLMMADEDIRNRE